jgi:putative ABC transport system permease protein
VVSSTLARSSLRHLWQHPLQTTLTILGMVIGVAVVVAVDLANSSAKRALALSSEMISGTATHHIEGGQGGVPEETYPRLRTELGLRASAPLVTDEVRTGGQYLTLLGIDFFAHRFSRPVDSPDLDRPAGRTMLLEPGSVAMARQTASMLGLALGDRFMIEHRGKAAGVQLVHLFPADHPASRNILLADIAVAQELLERRGSLDRIDLTLADAAAEARLRAWLPGGLSLVEADARRQSMAQMSRAFHTNLTAMSLLALLVGGFLIYNTVTFAVLRRRSQFGTLRVLGVSRGELYQLIFLEAVILGVVATGAGLAVGLGLGQLLIKLVTVTINDLYYRLHVSEFYVGAGSMVRGCILGIGTTALATWLPARAAARSAPVTLQRGSGREPRGQRIVIGLCALGVLAMAAGIALTRLSDTSLLLGFIALALAIIGYSLTVPLSVKALCALVGRMTSRRTPVLARLGLRGIDTGINRSGLAVAALALAVATTLGVSIMIGSFRQTVVDWLDQALEADIYITLRDARERADGDGLPAPLVDRLQQHPAVLRTRSARMRMADTDQGPVRLNALETSATAPGDLPLKGGNRDDVLRAFVSGEGLLVSEPFAYHRQIDAGDALTLHTPGGPLQLPVLGIFHDYTSGRGLVYLPLPTYRHWWEDASVSSLAIFRQPGADPSAFLDDLRSLAAGYGSSIRVSASEEIRSVSLQIFDRTFTVTEVLRLLAVIVAFIGVLTALLALQLDKRREHALLRAAGVTPGGIGSIIIGQTLLLGLFAGLLALPLGLLMAVLLIDVINLRSFGWSMGLLVPGAAMWQSLLLAVAAAVMAGLYPAWSSARLPVARALRQE